MRLEDGLKLDLNKLVREGFLPRDSQPLTVSTTWNSSHRGVLASALITILKEGEDRGSVKIVVPDKIEQRLDLIAEPRHFGGRQWYFRCPLTGTRCLVVWLPPGANRFCCRQAWGKQVAYSTQFEAPFDRPISARGKSQKSMIGELNLSEWELPPKPRSMRWHTAASSPRERQRTPPFAARPIRLEGMRRRLLIGEIQPQNRGSDAASRHSVGTSPLRVPSPYTCRDAGLERCASIGKMSAALLSGKSEGRLGLVERDSAMSRV